MAQTGWYGPAIKTPTKKMYLGPDELWFVVLHVAVGPYLSSRNWLQGDHNPHSSANAIIDNETGEISQLASIFDRTWANGLSWPKITPGIPWSPAAKRPIIGALRARIHPRITKGIDPNRKSISIERSGRPTDPWSPQAMNTLIGFLQFISRQTGIIYTPGQTLIGHRDIDPLGKGGCPGPLYDFASIAARANGTAPEDRTDPDAGIYTVERGPARVRSLKSSQSPSSTVRLVDVGQAVKVFHIQDGEPLFLYGLKSSQWAQVDGGWIWLPLLRRSI